MSDSPVKEFSRRGFITKVGQGLVAANVAGTFLKSAAAQEPLMVPDAPGKKLGWAVVGLGELAIYEILPAFAKCEKSKLVALVSGHPDKAGKLAARYGVNPKNIYNYQNYDSIRDNREVDVIYIVLPNGMHAEYTIRGFQAGKNVLTEKPMANTPAECQQMIDAGRKAGKKLRWRIAVTMIRSRERPFALCVQASLGLRQMIVADAGWNATDPNQWRLKKGLAGGGSMMDIGIYALNASRYFSGEEPTEVNAMMFNQPGDPRFKEVEETVNFQLRFPSGIMANCTSSYGYYHQSHYRVIGTKGHREMDPGTWYSGNHMRRQHDVDDQEITAEIDIPERNHFTLEMDHLSDCVMQNKAPLTPGEEGLRDIKLIMAIYEAAKDGKRVKV